MPQYSHSMSRARHHPPQFWIVTLRFLSVTQTYFYIFWSHSYRVFTGKYLDQQKVSIITSKVHGRLIRQKCSEREKNSRDNLFLVTQINQLHQVKHGLYCMCIIFLPNRKYQSNVYLKDQSICHNKFCLSSLISITRAYL